MKSWWMAAVASTLLVGVNSPLAQSFGAGQPPKIELPPGISPSDTLLPGQRQPAPIFEQPSAGTPAVPPATEPAVPPQPEEAPALPMPVDSPNAPAGTPPESPSGGEPQRFPQQRSPYDSTPWRAPADPNFVVPPSGRYVPGGMQGPASLAPSLSPGQSGAGAISFYSGMGSAMGAPTYGMPPVVSSGQCADSCGQCEECCRDRCCEPCFYGMVGGLIMGRNDPNRTWLSAQKSDYFNQLMNGADAAASWTGGWEATLGWFVPCCGALQFTYWGLAPTTGYDHVRMPGDLVTPINLNDVSIGGVGADYFYDNAQEHRVWRYDEFNNVELNFLGGPVSRPTGSLQIAWLAGVRYFRFRDRLLFGAVHEGFEFGSDGGVNEAYLDSALANNLIGGQVGAFVNWQLGPRWGLFFLPRVGVYANNINQHFQLYRGDGLSSIDIGTQKTVGSLLGEIDLGVNYFFARNWSVFVGYRVMAASGVGLADAQIPAFLVDTQEIQAIESNGDLILQGAIAGLFWWF